MEPDVLVLNRFSKLNLRDVFVVLLLVKIFLKEFNVAKFSAFLLITVISASSQCLLCILEDCLIVSRLLFQNPKFNGLFISLSLKIESLE